MLGDDVPDRFVCFQRRTGDPLCFGRTGATTIKIVDNDGKALLSTFVFSRLSREILFAR